MHTLSIVEFIRVLMLSEEIWVKVAEGSALITSCMEV